MIVSELTEISNLTISDFSRHLFWSYKRDASLPPALIIKQVIANGELSDLLLLSKKFPASVVLEVISGWKEKSRFRKRINLMEKVILSK